MNEVDHTCRTLSIEEFHNYPSPMSILILYYCLSSNTSRWQLTTKLFGITAGRRPAFYKLQYTYWVWEESLPVMQCPARTDRAKFLHCRHSYMYTLYAFIAQQAHKLWPERPADQLLLKQNFLVAVFVNTFKVRM